jgi:serine/threonine protein kinase
LIYALLSGEYPLNAAKDHIQMNEKVAKHVFELDRSQGQYSEGACSLVRKLLRKNPQQRLQSLSSIKKEQFFQLEICSFVDKTLQNEKMQQTGSSNNVSDNDISEIEKRNIISENFWNPYVIMENYSPLQMLFDEIYTLKQKQQQQQQQSLEIPPRKIKPRQMKADHGNNDKQELPSPPPPPPPPPIEYVANKAISNHAFEDDSSTTTTLSSQKSQSDIDNSPYIDDYEEDDDIQDYDVENTDPFIKF